MKTTVQSLMVFTALISSLMWSVNGSAATAERQEWSFRVFLDDDEVGYHDFRLSKNGPELLLQTEAKFDVKFLFVTAFRYRHENTEVWENGCLTSIDASTDNDGERLTVRGRRNAREFLVNSETGPVTLDGCVQTFAYWDPRILQADRLLNSQTGDYESVKVKFDGNDTVTLNDRAIDAKRYLLKAKGGTITLWYTPDEKRWLSLEAPVGSGRTLRYQPVAVPAAAALEHLTAGRS